MFVLYKNTQPLLRTSYDNYIELLLFNIQIRSCFLLKKDIILSNQR